LAALSTSYASAVRTVKNHPRVCLTLIIFDLFLDPILLKLCGSLTDVRLMLEIACEKLELELMYTDENKTPLNLLNDVLELEVGF
jgi:hypothetical protein